jgi:hypothetical protein
MPAKTRHPSWWSTRPESAWDRVREAVRRDWEQTKHDLKLRGGLELNQTISHTLKQVAGAEPIPTNERPNPGRGAGPLRDIEEPLRFGQAAFDHYGLLYPAWSAELEALLARDWERSATGTARPWAQVRPWVRQGYDHPAPHPHRERTYR